MRLHAESFYKAPKTTASDHAVESNHENIIYQFQSALLPNFALPDIVHYLLKAPFTFAEAYRANRCQEEFYRVE